MFSSDSKIYDPQTGMWTAARTYRAQPEGLCCAYASDVTVDKFSVFFNSTQPCNVVKTERGLSAELSRESEILTDDGMVKVRRLELGDTVATARLLPCMSNFEYDEKQMTQFAMQAVESNIVPPEVFMSGRLQLKQFMSTIEPSIHDLRNMDYVADLLRLYMRTGVAASMVEDEDGWSVETEMDLDNVSGGLYMDTVSVLHEVGDTEVWGTTVQDNRNLCVEGFFVGDS